MPSIILDTLIAYKFVKIISTPWKEMDAYKLGIIDENGKILKKRSSLTSQAERAAYPSIFYTLCWNIKKILDKVPVINLKSRPGALIASIMLLREMSKKDLTDPSIIDSLVKEEMEKRGLLSDVISESAEKPRTLVSGQYEIRGRSIFVESDLLPFDECLGHPVYKTNGMYFIFSEAKKKVDEDAPVNAVGTGNIAGASPGSEPPGPKGGWKALQKIRRRKKSAQIDRMDGHPKN
jgi:hypothetical protein